MVELKRKSFSKIREILEPPFLLELQAKSYEDFLQFNVHPQKRENKGLEAVFRSVFPIEDYSRSARLEYVGYEIGKWRCKCGEYKGLGGPGVVCDKCGENVFFMPKYSPRDCQKKGLTYGAPLRVLLRLITFDIDEETGQRTIRDIKEQKVYLGEIPLMTENYTFIINGVERVVVSQLHRSPGVIFEAHKTQSETKPQIIGRIIPYRGSWLDFEYDSKGHMYVRIDKRKRFPIAVFLLALGMTQEEILKTFYDSETIYVLEGGKVFVKDVTPKLIGQKVKSDIVDFDSGEVVVRKGRTITESVYRRLVANQVKRIIIQEDDIWGKPLASDVIDPVTGEVIAECNDIVTAEKLEEIRRRVDKFDLLVIESDKVDTSVRDSLIMEDKIKTREDALKEIYRKMRPGEPVTLEVAEEYFNRMLFDPERFDLSEVGRLKINRKFGFSDEEVPLSTRILRKEDIIAVVKHMMKLKVGDEKPDDIDHLGNRRVRAVGELLENQLMAGMMRLQKAIKEKMSIEDIESMRPYELLGAKPFINIVKSFFATGQLSQFMDQTNPLSEVTHKRRLSALGPGGLTRERAGFEVRDVHPSHYGRICPIETPEGQNIGLITSLTVFARVNKYGFIETPYRVVRDGRVTDEVVYLSALEESKYVIAQATAPVDEEGRLIGDLVPARKNEEFTWVHPSEVQLIDISPKQIVSVSASLIPFLEHDDANRALMGCNMQRQAVPLIKTEAPLIGTGMEKKVAVDSGAVVVAKRSGIVKSVDATKIIVAVDEEEGGGIDVYYLRKFSRSNQNSCYNQKPIVERGQRVEKGQVIADGPATENGELALGRNVLVAFMPWRGYNFEDAILVSERLVREDVYTSIHIEEFEVEARETKLGPEEITRDIPNVSVDALKNLDEFGIVRIGTKVKPGDILVGKVTPKSETQLSPEEKLMRVIFGEKAKDVKDTSLRVPPGVEGFVIGVEVFAARSKEGDPFKDAYYEMEKRRIEEDFKQQMDVLWEIEAEKLTPMIVGKKALVDIVDPSTGNVIVPEGEIIREEHLAELPRFLVRSIKVKLTKDERAKWDDITKKTNKDMERLRVIRDELIDTLDRPDELPSGVIKRVKVYVATKRKLQVGDKMAGRHGNKGVVSKVLPIEDMPYLEDGTPVDMVLNPLGVPSRMNVGQIFETHLGWAARELGKKLGELIEKYREEAAKHIREYLKDIYRPNDSWIDALNDDEVIDLARRLEKRGIPMASPVFDGATEEEVKSLLEKAGLPTTGRVRLYDGRTGEPFDQTVTVGYMYMLKLHHLVDDKIHARATGPYSLITQQPLGGKSHFGGQRLGEMEVWALEAHGAAYTLQEMLTVKSDDIVGRKNMFKEIIKGHPTFKPYIPESFRVLVKELQALGIDVELITRKKKY